MIFFHLLESVIFHHPRALRPHPFKENGFIFDSEFFDDRLKVDGMSVKQGEGLGWADPYLESRFAVQVF